MANTMTFNEAEEYVADYFGFRPRLAIAMDGGEVFDIPNPGLLDDDQQDRWDALQLELEKADTDGKGEPIRPYRIDGKLMKPSYNVRLAQVIFGDKYEAFKNAGGSGNQVGLEWARMNGEYTDGLQ